MSFAPQSAHGISVFQERTVRKHVVDNFDGAVSFMVVGFDWRSRWQLNTSAAGHSRDRFNPTTYYRSPGRNLVRRFVIDGAR